MSGEKIFRTCTDKACPNHPSNHGKGCTPSIRKNLCMGEIPTCFFVSALGDTIGISDWSQESFARLVMKKGEREAE